MNQFPRLQRARMRAIGVQHEILRRHIDTVYAYNQQRTEKLNAWKYIYCIRFDILIQLSYIGV